MVSSGPRGCDGLDYKYYYHCDCNRHYYFYYCYCCYYFYQTATGLTNRQTPVGNCASPMCWGDIPWLLMCKRVMGGPHGHHSCLINQAVVS